MYITATMRFLTLIIIISNLFTHIVFCQSQTADSARIVYGWKLIDNYSTPEKTEIDTNLFNFQIANPLYIESMNFSYLSNTGSTAISTVFFDRQENNDLFFANSYYHYFSRYSNTVYFNTNKPFSHIYYDNAGGTSSYNEQSFEILHTQNITNQLNFGIRFNVIASHGQFKLLDVKSNSFKIFTSYTGKKYMLHSTFNLNRYCANENGGINDSIFQAGEYGHSAEIPTTFSGETKYVTSEQSDAINTYRYFDYLLSQRIKIFSFGAKSINDTLDNPGTKTIAEPILIHVLRIHRQSKIYSDENPLEAGFYNNIYSNYDETYDSITEFSITNSLQLEFKTTFKNKVQTGIFGNINLENNIYSFYTEQDSTLNPSTLTSINDASLYVNHGDDDNINIDNVVFIDKQTDNYNLFFSGGLYGKFLNRFKSRFSGTIYFAGYKAGQTILDGLLSSKIDLWNNSFDLALYGTIKNLVPGYTYNNFYSNHYIWEQNLKSINKIHLSGSISSPSKKFSLKADYALLRNYIYFNDSLPVSYGQNLNVSSLSVEKEFSFWKIHSVNKLVYQVVENENVLSLPQFVFYNSTFFDKTWNFKITGGWLRTMLGFDIRYNTKYLGYGYIPALGNYYQQTEMRIGNYPYIDVFLNVRLKRTRFFVKMEHVNSSWLGQNYYLAVGYPSQERKIRFGLSWTFYD